MPQGHVIAECCHVVNVLPPISQSGGVLGDRFSMKNYGHASIIIQFGVTGAAATGVTINACTAATGGTKQAVAFNVYKEETANGDTLGAKVAATATGFVPSANNDIFYVIELDARSLPDGSPWVEIDIAAASGTTNLVNVVAILSGSRYCNPESATAIA